MKKIKISFSIRAFIVYFVILGALSWYLVSNALERLNDGMRQSAESVMVDMSYLFAAEIEENLADDQLLGKTLTASEANVINRIFTHAFKKKINAQIYQIAKSKIDTNVYITDAEGIVVYDSTGKSLGLDFSQWRDVRLTLEGEYGARTSFIDQEKTEDDDEKIMVVAAPINHNDEIVGVISVVKSIQSMEGHLKTESNQLKNYALALVLIAIVLGYIFSISLTNSLEKISNYAKNLANGKQALQPDFWDERLENLSNSVTNLRNQLDGKEYVENYIHSLTHELKTPITSIRGAAELLLEDIPADQQRKFIENINSSNHRMVQLVDKVLSLAKLENQSGVLEVVEFDLAQILERLLDERQALIDSKSVTISRQEDAQFIVNGDRLLIRQALANLLDNAISFSDNDSEIVIKIENQEDASKNYCISVFNQCAPIEKYALNRMFERFFSLPNKESGTAKTLKSTGLGLTFVKEIMSLHDGTVDIQNHQSNENISGVLAKLTWPIQ